MTDESNVSTGKSAKAEKDASLALFMPGPKTAVKKNGKKKKRERQSVKERRAEEKEEEIREGSGADRTPVTGNVADDYLLVSLLTQHSTSIQKASLNVGSV